MCARLVRIALNNLGNKILHKKVTFDKFELWMVCSFIQVVHGRTVVQLVQNYNLLTSNRKKNNDVNRKECRKNVRNKNGGKIEKIIDVLIDISIYSGYIVTTLPFSHAHTL